MQIEAVKVQRLYLQVADQLSALIRGGELDIGARLPSERDLAAQFGVSRPTVREALIALEIAGLVEIRSGSGVYVLSTVPDFQPAVLENEYPGPLEILEARRIIEGETAALAAQRISTESLAQLEAQLRILGDESANTEDREKADQNFHELIAAATGNSALHSSINWLWELRNRSRISHDFHQRLRLEGSSPVIHDHQAILDALRTGNADQARERMHIHLQRVMQQILR